MGDSVIQTKNQESVIAHVEMMQGIISRLAENSAKCKEWCFTLIGVLIVFLYSSDNAAKIDFKLLYCIIGIFGILDAYYLGLERNQKEHLTTFITNINDEKDNYDMDIFLPYGAEHEEYCWFEKFINQLKWTFCSLFSFSVLIPYGLMILATWMFSPTS